jgi:hypothetical protein
MATTGKAVAVANGVGATATANAAFSASHTGVLAHAKQIGLSGELQWLDRSGKRLGSVGTPAEYLDVELSPDERTVAVSRVDPKLNTADIWLLDLARNLPTRFTVDPLHDASPFWSPDGGRIVFRSNRRGPPTYLKSDRSEPSRNVRCIARGPMLSAATGPSTASTSCTRLQILSTYDR